MIERLSSASVEPEDVQDGDRELPNAEIRLARQCAIADKNGQNPLITLDYRPSLGERHPIPDKERYVGMIRAGASKVTVHA
jgi:hypothetical protein